MICLVKRKSQWWAYCYTRFFCKDWADLLWWTVNHFSSPSLWSQMLARKYMSNIKVRVLKYLLMHSIYLVNIFSTCMFMYLSPFLWKCLLEWALVWNADSSEVELFAIACIVVYEMRCAWEEYVNMFSYSKTLRGMVQPSKKQTCHISLFFNTGIRTTPVETFDWCRFLQNAGISHFFFSVFTIFILNRHNSGMLECEG